MIKNVKSSYYFNKLLFSFIEEGQKLKLVKYNKIMQNNLDISLINYKYFSQRYIIYESKGKGKEYWYDGELIFEGEYLNGERNGKGKEYDNKGKLIFEGEYLNGIEWKGKGYDKNGNIIYELNNTNENTKEYDYDGKLIYEGEYLNGERNGKGKEYDFDKLI